MKSLKKSEYKNKKVNKIRENLNIATKKCDNKFHNT